MGGAWDLYAPPIPTHPIKKKYTKKELHPGCKLAGTVPFDALAHPHLTHFSALLGLMSLLSPVLSPDPPTTLFERQAP